MGYTTDFRGSFKFDKPLNSDQIAYINAFSESRRMKRNLEELESEASEKLRIAVNLPYGIEGEFCVDNDGDSFFNWDNINLRGIDYNNPPSSQPSLWCDWCVNERELFWNGTEKFYEYVDWLEYMIKNFFEPWGYKLNGAVDFYGEDSHDFGTIFINDNVVKIQRV